MTSNEVGGTQPMFECQTCCQSFTIDPNRCRDRITCPHCGAHYIEQHGEAESIRNRGRRESGGTP